MINQYKVMHGWDRWLLPFSWKLILVLEFVSNAIFAAAVVAEVYFLYDNNMALDIVL